jgi:hypothetical protein
MPNNPYTVARRSQLEKLFDNAEVLLQTLFFTAERLYCQPSNLITKINFSKSNFTPLSDNPYV